MKKRTAVFLFAISLAVATAGYFPARHWVRDPGAVNDGIVAWKNGDYGAAYKLLAPESQKGNKRAQRVLGTMYAYGLGVPRDRDRARVLLKSALGESSTDTYIWIGRAFEKGEGVPVDRAESIAWYRIAAAEGNVEAHKMLEQELRESGPSSL